MTNSRHIFVSYRSTELDFALRLAADLKNAGVNLWIDRLDIQPGDDWLKRLQSGVNDCEAMISILTPEYVASRYCQREMARADRLARPIIPVLLRAIPDDEWPIEIERQQYIDFTNWRDEATYRHQLARLVAMLRNELPEQIRTAPDPETQYLTRLIAELEASKGVMEYVELSAEADRILTQDDIRPRPRFAEAWSMPGAFSVVDSGKANGNGRQQSTPLAGIGEAVEKFPRFVLIGPPGAGKTTTLRHLVLTAARARQFNGPATPLPLYLKLTSWTDQTSVDEFIRAHWPLAGDPMTLLEQGQVSLYLDGLNEMGASGPGKAAVLRAWLRSAAGPQRVVVTCRASDYRGRMTLPLPVVQAADMDRPRVEQFVHNYLGDDAAESFLLRILPADEPDDPRHPLFQLARNPFLLGGLILLFKGDAEAELPTSKGALLQRMAAEMWKQKALREPGGVEPHALEAALTALAFSMIDEDLPIYAPSEYVREHLPDDAAFDTATAAKFLELEGDSVRFSHQLMQEYFAALGVWRAGLPTRLTHPRFDTSGRRLPTKWDPVLVTLAGISAPPDPVIRAIAEVDPFLALECICCGIGVTPGTYQQTVQLLHSAMRSEDQDGRVAAAELLTAVRDESALPILLDAMRDGTWDVREAGTAVLRSFDPAILPGLTQALADMEHDIRDATATAVRQMAETAVPTLIHLLNDDSPDLRRSAAWALGETRDPAAVPALVEALHDEVPLVAVAAAKSLGWIKDETAVPWLASFLRHDHARVRKAAAGALGWIGVPALDTLLGLLNDSSGEVRQLAVDSLKNIHHPAVLPALLQATYDSHAEVRSAAVEALKNMEDARAVKRLIELLSDTVPVRVRGARQRVSDIAARILESIGTIDALAAVARWRRSQSRKPGAKSTDRSAAKPTEPVKTIVATAPATAKTAKVTAETAESAPAEAVVGEPAPAEAVPPAASIPAGKTAKADKAAKAASKGSKPKKSAPQVKERLKQLRRGNAAKAASAKPQSEFADLTAHDWSTRRGAVLALAEFEPGIALPKLVKALDDEDNQVRLAAVQVLSGIRDEVATNALLDALGDQDFLVSDAAAAALRAIGTSTLPGLLRAAASQNINMRGAAIEVLGKIGDASAVPILIAALSDTSRPWLAEQRICDYAARALAAIGTPDALSALEAWRSTIDGQAYSATSSAKPTVAPLPTWESRGQHDAPAPHKEILSELLEGLRDGEWGVRQEAAKAMREYAKSLHGSTDATRDILRLTDALNDEDWVIRHAAAEALPWTGDQTAVPALVGRLDDDIWMVRVAATRALLELGDAAAAPNIMRLLDDRNANVREAAAEALGGLGDTNAIPALQRLIADDEKFVRIAVIEALGRLGDESVIPTLIRALGDEDMLVRWPAAEALGRLKAVAAVPELINHLQDTAGPHWEEQRVCDIVAAALLSIGTAEAKMAVDQWRQSQPERT